MADELRKFHTKGPSWAERAHLGGLRAVLSPTSEGRQNDFLHGVNTFGAKRALRAMPSKATIVDFGCGTGRFSRFFAAKGCRVLGTEITPEMIDRARVEGSSENCSFAITDGVSIPVGNESIDAIWCCGVLRYSLFVSDPVYDKIAVEMFRVLRPGGVVVNLEMYVDREPKVFLTDFEQAGFITKDVRVLQRYGARVERYFGNRRWPRAWIFWLAQRSAHLRCLFDNPELPAKGLRDYLFSWEKPAARK